MRLDGGRDGGDHSVAGLCQTAASGAPIGQQAAGAVRGCDGGALLPRDGGLVHEACAREGADRAARGLPSPPGGALPTVSELQAGAAQHPEQGLPDPGVARRGLAARPDDGAVLRPGRLAVPHGQRRRVDVVVREPVPRARHPVRPHLRVGGQVPHRRDHLRDDARADRGPHRVLQPARERDAGRKAQPVAHVARGGDAGRLRRGQGRHRQRARRGGAPQAAARGPQARQPRGRALL